MAVNVLSRLDVVERYRVRVTAALVEAFANKHVRRGMIATALITLGSLTPAYTPENSPWWQLLGGFRTWYSWIGLAAGLIGVVLLLDSWFHVRPRNGLATVPYRAVIALWALPMLLAPPIFSHDAYAYAAEGFQLHIGQNPYLQPTGAIGGRWSDQVVEVWRFTQAPYGPLDLVINHAIVDATGQSPYWSSALGMRAAAVVGVLVMAYTLPRIATRVGIDAQQALWFGVANPLVITHLIGGAHNDSLMLMFMCLAIAAAERRRFLLGCGLVACAAAVKVPAILTVVPVALLALPNYHPREGYFGRLGQAAWRVALGTLVVAIVFVLINQQVGLGWGWIGAVNVPSQVPTIAPSSMIGQLTSLIMNQLGFYRAAIDVLPLVRNIGMIVTVVVILFLLARHAPSQPFRFLSFALAALALGSPAAHPWYFTWAFAFFALAQPSRRLLRIACWFTAVLMAYSTVNFAVQNGRLGLSGVAILIGAASAVAFAWVMWGHDRTHFRDPS